MAKNLQIPLQTLKKGDIYAQKVLKALQTYPFNDISPDLELTINPRSKRMALRVDVKSRKVRLVMPVRASMRSAYRFALENKYWIREKIGELPEIIEYKDGSKIKILGKPVTIHITYNPTLKTTSIQLINNQLEVLTNKQDPSARIRRFIIQMAKEHLSALSHEKAALIHKKILKIDVKDTSSRWGSCSSDGRLSYSWRLIFAPEHAFDYVVAHEVAHLQHMDHSPAFWDVCESLSNDYSRGKSWMKNKAAELIQYA
ncbi:MAG: SprT family zinc-dependent metalloprotease [Pseudomonadota bacterium]